MSELIFLVEEDPEDGFTARGIGQSIFTEADSLEYLRANIREAVQAHFDTGKGPKVVRLYIVRDEILAA